VHNLKMQDMKMQDMKFQDMSVCLKYTHRHLACVIVQLGQRCNTAIVARVKSAKKIGYEKQC